MLLIELVCVCGFLYKYNAFVINNVEFPLAYKLEMLILYGLIWRVQ